MYEQPGRSRREHCANMLFEEFHQKINPSWEYLLFCLTIDFDRSSIPSSLPEAQKFSANEKYEFNSLVNIWKYFYPVKSCCNFKIVRIYCVLVFRSLSMPFSLTLKADVKESIFLLFLLHLPWTFKADPLKSMIHSIKNFTSAKFTIVRHDIEKRNSTKREKLAVKTSSMFENLSTFHKWQHSKKSLNHVSHHFRTPPQIT